MQTYIEIILKNILKAVQKWRHLRERGMISKIGNFANTGKDMLSLPNAEFYHINLTSISTFCTFD